MYRKILVALDLSENSQMVFEQALNLAKATAANLMLLHVLSNEEEGSPDVSMLGWEYYPVLPSEMTELQRKQWSEYESRGVEILQSYAEQASAAGVVAETSQKFGSPGRTICGTAISCDADLIVVGRRGHSGFSEFLLGSVSNYVLHHAPCPVLTVQGTMPTETTITQTKQQSMTPS